MTTKFQQDIYSAVRRIPSGKVATYAQIAAMSGHIGAARAVGNALHVNPEPIATPCHRVVNSVGRLAPGFAFGGPDMQRRLLEKEGVTVGDDNTVDLFVYQWRG